jgi:hypothetical protein
VTGTAIVNKKRNAVEVAAFAKYFFIFTSKNTEVSEGTGLRVVAETLRELKQREMMQNYLGQKPGQSKTTSGVSGACVRRQYYRLTVVNDDARVVPIHSIGHGAGTTDRS